MTPTRSALLLARIRAEGAIPAVEASGVDLATEAAAVGRRVVRVDSTLRAGWADGHEPAPDGPTTARLSTFPTGVLAAALALAWRDPSIDPHPGEPLPENALGRLALILDRNPIVVSKYLAELRSKALVDDNDDGTLRLGPLVATWSPRLITALRRHHHLFTAADGGFA